MTLELLISSVIITIIPIGGTLPNTEDICWWETGWVYTEGKIYVCDTEYKEFSTHHEIGHFLWENVLTMKDRENYLKLYQRDKKRGIKAFHSDYELSDWEESFCTDYSLMKIWEKTNIFIKKRQKLILKIINSL